MALHDRGAIPPELGIAIDTALARYAGRALVSGREVVDTLLDIRITAELEARLAALLAPEVDDLAAREPVGALGGAGTTTGGAW